MSQINTIDTIYDDYCQAIDWADNLIDSPLPNNRFHGYKETLKKQLEEFSNVQKVKDVNAVEMVSHLEANVEAFALIGIHKKFFNRQEKEFKVKLRESLFGPVYAFQEKLNGPSFKKSSFGRNIQSELIIASKIKNSEIVSFTNGNDIFYDLVDFKFGIECKRINSDSNDQIKKLFAKACQQLEDNSAIDYGMVAMRLDKWHFVNKIGNIYLPRMTLVEKGNVIHWAQTIDDAYREFRKQGDPSFMKISINYLQIM